MTCLRLKSMAMEGGMVYGCGNDSVRLAYGSNNRTVARDTLPIRHVEETCKTGRCVDCPRLKDR